MQKFNPPKGCTHIWYNPTRYHTFSYFKESNGRTDDIKWYYMHPTWNTWEPMNPDRNNETFWKLK